MIICDKCKVEIPEDFYSVTIKKNGCLLRNFRHLCARCANHVEEDLIIGEDFRALLERV